MLRRLISGLFAVAMAIGLAVAPGCGGGKSPLTPGIDHILTIDIRPMATEQYSLIIPIQLELPPPATRRQEGAIIRIGWRYADQPDMPLQLLTAAPASPDLNRKGTIVTVPVSGTLITFLWDALADLGIDWDPSRPIVLRAGVLPANAPDAREAVCLTQPQIFVIFSGVQGACETDAPRLDDVLADQATVGQPYDYQIPVTGGELPLRFDLIDQQSFEPSGNIVGFGLTLDPQTGRITGTPDSSAPVQITLVVRVTDSCNVNSGARAGAQSIPATGRFDQGIVRVPVEGGIAPQCDPAPSITTTGLPVATLDAPYSLQLTATGGEGQLTWDAEGLPAGFTLTAAGLLSGTPTAPGDFDLILTVSDSCEIVQSASAEFTLSVPCGAGPSFQTPPGALPNAEVGTLYDVSIPVSTPNGPGTGTLSAGTLPAGIILTPVLDPDNRRLVFQLRGTPSNASQAGQTFNFTLRAADDCPAGELAATRDFSITLNPASGCTEPTPVINSPTGTDDLPGGTAGQAYSATLSVVGGTPPVGGISIVSGAPAGFTIQADGRTFAGTLPATGPSSYAITFRVEDGCSTPRVGQRTLTLPVTTVCPTLSISTSGLPNATNGALYSTTLQAVGGEGTLSWRLAAASGALPFGLSISTAGVISGVPNDEPGTYPLIVEVTDSCPGRAQSDTRALDLVLEDAVSCAPVVFTTEAVPDAVLNQPYSFPLQVTGGEPPFTFELLEGRLPNGMDLGLDGVLSGTPFDSKEVGQVFEFTVLVTDSCLLAPGTDARTFTLELLDSTACTPLVILTDELPTPVFGEPYFVQLDAQGEAPFFWSLVEGSLPSGLNLTTEGAISGTPDSTKDIGVPFNFSCEVQDSCDPEPQFFIGNFDLTVEGPDCASLSITTTALPPGSVGITYSFQVQHTGGEGAIAWSIDAEDLPPGMSFSATGFLSGTPLVADTYSLTFFLTDSCAIPQEDSRTLELVIDEEPVECPDLEITTEDLPDAPYGAPYSTSLEAAGTGPYFWSLIGGDLPSGLSLTANGHISGTPDDENEIGQTFEVTFEVTDSCPLEPLIAETTLTIDVTAPECDPLSITTDVIPNGTLDLPYSFQFEAEGGEGALSWQFAGGFIPDGLTVAADGLMSGTPTEAGEFRISIAVTDSCTVMQEAVRSYTFFINEEPVECPELVITTSSLPDAPYGAPYSAMLEAEGTGPYFWSLVGGDLPSGLSLTTDGQISGTPDDENDIGQTFEMTFEVTDSCPLEPLIAETTLTIDVTAPDCDPLSMVTERVDDGETGTPYSFTFEADGGASPLTWTVLEGDLPPGLQLEADGVLQGTPTEAGEFTFVVSVADACALVQEDNRRFTLVIFEGPTECPELVVLTDSLPPAYFGSPYFAQLEADGTAPYFWSLTVGELPAGLTLSVNGQITGAPDDPGQIGLTFTFQCEVQDSCTIEPQFFIAEFDLAVEEPECDPISITTDSLPAGTVDEPYGVQLEFAGGEEPVEWSWSGRPAEGLTLNGSGFLSGTPTESGTFDITITVTDSCSLPQSASRDYELVIRPATGECDPVFFTTEGLSDAVYLESYDGLLEAEGGTGELTFEIIEGALPEGMDLASDGTLFGTPINPFQIGEEFRFLAQVTDQCEEGPARDEREFSLVLTGPPPCSPVVILNEGFANPILNTAYSIELIGDGNGELNWTLAGGTLPTGMGLVQSGDDWYLAGTPAIASEVGTTFTFTLRLTDSCFAGAQSTEATFQFTLEDGLEPCGTPVITTVSVPNPRLFVPYCFQLQAEGGRKPYTWQMVSGSLPHGMWMTSSGKIVGKPKNWWQCGKSFTFRVRVKDACGNWSESRQYTIKLKGHH